MLSIDNIKVNDYVVMNLAANIGSEYSLDVVKGQWLKVLYVHEQSGTLDLVSLDGKKVTDTFLDSRYRFPYKNEVKK